MKYRMNFIDKDNEHCEGWAKDFDEALSKFEEQMGHTEVFVFLAGDEPKYLSYNELLRLHKAADNPIGLNQHLLDSRSRIILQTLDQETGRMLGYEVEDKPLLKG